MLRGGESSGMVRRMEDGTFRDERGSGVRENGSIFERRSSLSYNFCGNPGDGAVVGDVVHDDGICADTGALADFDVANHSGASADKHIAIENGTAAMVGADGDLVLD